MISKRTQWIIGLVALSLVTIQTYHALRTLDTQIKYEKRI